MGRGEKAFGWVVGRGDITFGGVVVVGGGDVTFGGVVVMGEVM